MEKQNRTLTDDIIELQRLKREGDYWDFKREWHHSKGDLLHDIICMANNLSGHNGYLIIGIDEKNAHKVVDVSNDPNRKNTQNIVDFLSSKRFAGDVRPFAYVETISLEGRTVDVLVVVSDNRVPYYLVERFEKVCDNNIYIRVGDTNTPVTRTADIDHIEKLWKRRFGLDLSPIDKVNVYLSNTSNWIELYGGDGYYYKLSPEFRVQFEEDPTRTAYEYYMFSQIDSNPLWYITRVYYHQTPIEEIICNLLDGGRLFVSAPDWRLINTNSSQSFLYHSYTKDSLKWLLNDLLNVGHSDAEYEFSELLSCIPVFENEYERLEFEKYVVDNYDENKQVEYAQQIKPIVNITNDQYKIQLENDYKNALYLIEMLNEYRKSKTSSIGNRN